MQKSTSSRKRGADARVQLPETAEPRAYSLSVVQRKAKFDDPKRSRDSGRVMRAEVPLQSNSIKQGRVSGRDDSGNRVMVGGQRSSGPGAQDQSNDASFQMDEDDFVTITGE